MKNKKTATKGRARTSVKRIKSRRPAHKRFILHPLTVFLLLCVGVLLTGFTWKTSADSYSVKAKVAAPPLTDPAIITSPADGNHFKAKPIEVDGTCPDDSYINLMRNGIFSGTALCDNVTNTFTLQTDLSAGANILQAQDYNITDDAGPQSGQITVYYDPPPPPAVATQSSSPNTPSTTSIPSANAAPFFITSEYAYRGYLVGETTNWQIKLSGGVKPYALNVKWGDGQENNYANNAQEIDISHAYNKAGNYNIQIYASDANGNTGYLQVVSVVKQSGALQLNGTLQRPLSGITSSLRQWIWVVWPAYTVMVLMVISFWLGEREEVRRLTSKRRVAHRH